MRNWQDCCDSNHGQYKEHVQGWTFGSIHRTKWNIFGKTCAIHFNHPVYSNVLALAAGRERTLTSWKLHSLKVLFPHCSCMRKSKHDASKKIVCAIVHLMHWVQPSLPHTQILEVVRILIYMRQNSDLRECLDIRNKFQLLLVVGFRNRCLYASLTYPKLLQKPDTQWSTSRGLKIQSVLRIICSIASTWMFTTRRRSRETTHTLVSSYHKLYSKALFSDKSRIVFTIARGKIVIIDCVAINAMHNSCGKRPKWNDDGAWGCVEKKTSNQRYLLIIVIIIMMHTIKSHGKCIRIHQQQKKRSGKNGKSREPEWDCRNEKEIE